MFKKIKKWWLHKVHRPLFNNYKTTLERRTSCYSISIQVLMQYTISAIFMALAFILKLAFAAIPNFEFATFVLIVSTVFFTWQIGLMITNGFCLLNIVFFGIADWSIYYFIIFNLYFLIALSLRRWILKKWWLFVITVSLMGYVFGFLFALDTWVLYGFAYALSYWISGLWFDVIHGTGNLFIGALLYLPVSQVMFSFARRYSFLFNNLVFNIIN